jgi:beta-lactamase class A
MPSRVMMTAAALAWYLVLPTTAVAQSRAGTNMLTEITGRIAATPGAVVAVSFRDLGTGDAIDIGGDVDFHAASTMKVAVMIEVLRAVDAGRLFLNQQILLVNRFYSIVDGSPFALDSRSDSDSSLYANVNDRVPVSDLLERMIIRSSNLATNVLIALVGPEATNATAHALGATHMQVLRGVEDSKAFDAGRNNTTTSRDLAILLERIERGTALGKSSTRLMRDVLVLLELNEEIPAGLPAGTPVAHKTGSITATLHDAAIVYPPGRLPYVLVVLTRNISDERVAKVLIADISRIVWNHEEHSNAPLAATAGHRP